MAFRIKNISNIEYLVQDLDGSIDFFTKTLGFYLQRRTHRDGPLAPSGNAVERGQHVFVGMGSTWVELMPPPQNVPQDLAYSDRKAPNYVFAVSVEDLDDGIRQMRAQGLRVSDPDFVKRQSFLGRQALVDPGPWGQPIALREFRAPDHEQNMNWAPDEQSGYSESRGIRW